MGIKRSVGLIGYYLFANQLKDRFVAGATLQDAVNKEGLTDVNVAEKPSQIGLDLSEYLYCRNKVKILEAARMYLPNGFVETDAEDHSYRESVFGVALELSEWFTNQILACQINLHRTIWEVKKLQDAGVGLRICKVCYASLFLY